MRSALALMLVLAVPGAALALRMVAPQMLVMVVAAEKVHVSVVGTALAATAILAT